MKTILSFAALLFSLLVISSCKGDRWDYRHKYIGEFEVTGTYIFEYLSSNDSFPISGVAEIELAETENQLLFYLPEFDSVYPPFKFWVDKDDNLAAASATQTEGKFSDKNHFTFSALFRNPVDQYTKIIMSGTRK
jgi:hypothetical protein